MSAENVEDRTNGFYGMYGKRVLDLVLSIPSFILLLPILLATAILIKLETPGPVVFAHDRVGCNGRVFKLYKFRTMVENASKIGPPITQGNDPRITGVGRLLRRFKVDEMPQIINVIKGDMSVIGPRPEIKKYVELFKEDYNEILKIKPGMTDYALIAFRNEETVLAKFNNAEEGYVNELLPKKITLYRKYLKDISITTDVQIFFRTIWEILWR